MLVIFCEGQDRTLVIPLLKGYPWTVDVSRDIITVHYMSKPDIKLPSGMVCVESS